MIGFSCGPSTQANKIKEKAPQVIPMSSPGQETELSLGLGTEGEAA